MPRLVLLGVLVVVGVTSGSASAAVSLYASPTGTGDACTQAARCSLTTAIDKAVPGDDVFIIAGQGDYRFGGTILANGIRFHGENGRPRLIFDDGGLELMSGSADGLYVQGGGDFTGLRLDAGASADRMIAVSGATGHACIVRNGATLTNSICWAGRAGDRAMELDGNMTLRNVTAVGGFETAIEARGRVSRCGCSAAVQTLVNVIARAGPGGIDLNVWSDGTASVTVNVTNSNYLTTGTAGGGAPAQTRLNADSTNQTTAPMFVDAANGDFRQAPGSPTINRGVNDPANGSADFEGEARIGGGTTDIGADELIPAAPAFAGVVLGKQTAVVKGGKAPVKVSCPAAAMTACTGTLTLTARAAGKAFVAGKAAFTIASGAVKSVVVKLTAKALSLLKPGKSLKTTASAVAKDARGVAKTSTAAVTLKRGK